MECFALYSRQREGSAVTTNQNTSFVLCDISDAIRFVVNKTYKKYLSVGKQKNRWLILYSGQCVQFLEILVK
jgi:hypothetical protein